jgi:voltage-gated potassium channel
MVALLITLAQFGSAVRMAWRDPTFRLLATLTALLLAVGTLVFHEVEGWAYLDSFYFSAITLATVGYGDFTPRTPVGKLLTVFYIFMGFGLLVALLTRFAEKLIQAEQESRERRRLHRMQAREKKAARGAGTAQPSAITEPPGVQDEHVS